MLEFTDNEKRLIKNLSIKDGWNHEDAKPLKKKITKHLKDRHAVVQCCYCRRDLHMGHGLIIDPEHVLPKGKFPQYAFEMKNLSLSCKRCNMGIKGEKTSFYLGAINAADPFLSDHYSFIHPNFDVVKDHLKIRVLQEDDDLLIKYTIVDGSLKGTNAYRFFELEKIEINTFDDVQGTTVTEISSEMPESIIDQIVDIVEELEE